jgi:hypothetical protein
MKDIFFFVVTAVDANPMGQLGGPTLRAFLGLNGLELVGGTPHVAPRFGFSFFWNWHACLKKLLYINDLA